MCDMSSSEDNTLPDDAWKDSFDKLLEEKPILREMKLLKRDVRASFNMNSSYENSCFGMTTNISERKLVYSEEETISNPKNANRERESTRKISLTVAAHRKSISNRKHSSLGTITKTNFKRQLLSRCNQRNVLLFANAYNEKYLENCEKIGEGAFGEVFLYRNSEGKERDNVVLKIIPIEGKQLVNGEAQKSFEQIMQEVVISMELCGLRNENRGMSFANGFVNIVAVRCVKGQYPAHLQKLWEEYDLEKESENDHPECFSSDQIYVILEMAFSGKDMEKFIFQNAEQAFYALKQIIFALAVGEDVYEFEHRDLHWGNVLIAKTDQKYFSYKIKGQSVNLASKGVQVTIIDYTLSRITYGDCCYFNDLSLDKDLFTATGDYQFDIYRMMRDILNDKWDTFEPKTNIYWISYIISKLLNDVTYKSNRSKLHLQYIEKLRDLESTILSYKSCMDCAMSLLLDS
ncbi:serine/threonine-protein kinase haspin homolog [Musca vetustissima]|uniref:serine/threonine-protein kinase haspin homolog n=1 Tax=Musca vetustissima TaxID=27455 RepID=UPI002AB76510|nr:serine/threonine-protein kinase haspin homolog [Musca vetustissima]